MLVQLRRRIDDVVNTAEYIKNLYGYDFKFSSANSNSE